MPDYKGTLGPVPPNPTRRAARELTSTSPGVTSRPGLGSARVRWRSTAGWLAPAASSATLLVVLAFHSGGYLPSEWGLAALVFLLAGVTALLLADSVAVTWPRIVLPLSLVGLGLWQLLSILWSTGAALPAQEAERTLIYVSAAAALVLCLTPGRVEPLLAGIATGATVVAVYSLGTRLAPGTLGGAYDPSSGYQLAKPIGYANALGLLFVLGATLAAGIALHGRRALAVAAGATLVPLLVGAYFTFSRGAVGALVVGLGLMLALEHESRRAAGLVAVLLACPAVGVLLASRDHALTSPGATLQTAQSEGHRLIWQLAILSVVAAATTAGVRTFGRRVPLSPIARGALAVGLCLAAVAALVVGVVRAGGPASLVTHVRHETEARPERGPKGRLLSVRNNGRADYWTVAGRMVERNPVLGDGAGAFALRWPQERPIANDARDAHNLYLETLAELGPVGLVLLLAALATPLLGLRGGRPPGLAPAAAGAYVAVLAHAALDWDWEIPLLTLAALACGASLLVLASNGTDVRLTAGRRCVGLLAAAALLVGALVTHVGNEAAADAARALARGDAPAAATDARRARSWMPWSYEPWQLLGEAQLAAGAHGGALASLRRASRLDPGQWRVWLDLAVAERGERGRSALARATDLNPLGPTRQQNDVTLHVPAR